MLRKLLLALPLALLLCAPAEAETYRGLTPGKTVLTPALVRKIGQVKPPSRDADLITYYLRDPACRGGVLRVEVGRDDHKVFGIYITPAKDIWAVDVVERFQTEPIGYMIHFDDRPAYVVRRRLVAVMLTGDGSTRVDEVIHYAPSWRNFDDAKAKEMKGRDLYLELSDV